MALNEGKMAERGVRKRLTGVVVGNKMDKTVVVLVNTLKRHKTYNKFVRRDARYMAHDPQNRCQVGDKVRIIESRPISKNKSWQVIEIIETAARESFEDTGTQELEV